MKRRFVSFIVIFFAICGVLAAQDLSGVLDSTVNYTAAAGEPPEHSFGFEQFANIRLRVRGERASFISAFNLIAVSGNHQENAADIELERLYFRVNGDHFDTEAGLMRIAFGYGQVWGPSDFLNPRNPLSHNARPSGVLGTTFSFYPTDSMELMLFAAAPKDHFNSDGGGFLPGLSLDQHWSRASLQSLYVYETPLAETEWGRHRFGLSLKADLELGFVADMLYTLNPASHNDIEGLSASAGFDYSFLEGDIYFLFEYLFNGSESATALGSGGFFTNSHYLNGTVSYRFNDYSSLTLSTIFCFDDLTFQPMARLDYELFQGFSLNLALSVPLDHVIVNAGVRMRF